MPKSLIETAQAMIDTFVAGTPDEFRAAKVAMLEKLLEPPEGWERGDGGDYTRPASDGKPRLDVEHFSVRHWSAYVNGGSVGDGFSNPIEAIDYVARVAAEPSEG